jgi:hypothetical protein
MHLPNMEVYDDDEIQPAECKVASRKSRRLSETMHTIGRLEKSKSVPHVKLLGPEFKPRAILQAVKDRAVNGARAALVCIDRTTEHLVFIWAHEADDNVYRLANLKAARGFVLGALVFNPDQSIDRYAEQDEEREFKALLLDFYARLIQNANAQTAADELLMLAGDFTTENAETTLDRHPINIHDEITFPEGKAV